MEKVHAVISAMKVMKDSSLQFDTQNNLLLLPSSVSSMSVWRMAAPRLLLLLTVSHHTRYLLVKTDEDGTASRRANMRNKGTRHSINQALMNLTMALLNLIVLVNLMKLIVFVIDNNSYEPDCSCEPYAPDCFC